jgi:cytochrome c oxidase subunit 2
MKSIFNLLITYLDVARPYQLSLQDENCGLMAGIADMYEFVTTFLIFIIIIVFTGLLIIFRHFLYKENKIIKFKDNIIKFHKYYSFYPILSYKHLKFFFYVLWEHFQLHNKKKKFKKLKNSFIFFFDLHFQGRILDKNIRLFTKTNINKFLHSGIVEIIWSFIPFLILVLLIIPSFFLLYALDYCLEFLFSIKIMGHQWYWTYDIEFPTFILSENKTDYIFKFVHIIYDSYMLSLDELIMGELRLLEVDNSLYTPINTHIEVLISSDDVIHSWTIPSLGAKVDAVPGRLNNFSLFLERLGIFHGQCSEICGINHGFMPIKQYGLTFIDWFKFYNEIINK